DGIRDFHVTGVQMCSSDLITAEMLGTLEPTTAPKDVIDVMERFLVRRPRKYIDATQQEYDKVGYRRYNDSASVATEDAFASIVTIGRASCRERRGVQTTRV